MTPDATVSAGGGCGSAWAGGRLGLGFAGTAGFSLSRLELVECPARDQIDRADLPRRQLTRLDMAPDGDVRTVQLTRRLGNQHFLFPIHGPSIRPTAISITRKALYRRLSGRVKYVRRFSGGSVNERTAPGPRPHSGVIRTRLRRRQP
jgi:hypothetical protein